MRLGQLEPEATLHGREKLDAGSVHQNALDQPQVGEVVFDTQYRSRWAGRLRRGFIRQLGGGGWAFCARQFHPEATSTIDGAVRPYGTPHGLHEPPRQREAKSRALHTTLLSAEPIEGREEPRHLLLGNAKARIGHREPEPFS